MNALDEEGRKEREERDGAVEVLIGEGEDGEK